jgi:purine-cytosine permease-like protein
MMPFAIVGDLQGPVAKLLGGADISMPIGLLVAAGLYLVFCRSLDLTAERQRVAVADAGLDPDA